MIKSILFSSKITKYPKWFQSKTGVYLLFLEIKDTMGNKYRFYLSYDNAFVDIDNNVHYQIMDEEQRLWIRQFQEKYRNIKLGW